MEINQCVGCDAIEQRRVDGVEDDTMIQHRRRREILMSTQVVVARRRQRPRRQREAPRLPRERPEGEGVGRRHASGEVVGVNRADARRHRATLFPEQFVHHSTADALAPALLF